MQLPENHPLAALVNRPPEEQAKHDAALPLAVAMSYLKHARKAVGIAIANMQYDVSPALPLRHAAELMDDARKLMDMPTTPTAITGGKP